MLEYFIKNHLDKYKEKSGVIVFKGFSDSFFKELEKIMPKAFDHDYLEGTNKDFNALKVEGKRITKTFILEQESKMYFAKYEEILAFKDYLALIDGEKIIITNNLIDKYPYDFSSIKDQVKSYIREIQEEKITEKKYLFTDYFGEIDESKEGFYVKYKELDEELNFKKINLINNKKINIPEVKILSSQLENLVVFPNSGDNSLIEAQVKVLEKNEKNLNLILEKYVLKSPKHLEQLSSINEFYSTLGVKINLYSEGGNNTKEYRNEFKSILKTYWGSDSFRNLDIYNNPDTSTEVESTSQGIIIEDIVGQVEKARKGEQSKDIFITAPTGSGKSVLFQIPALYLMKKYKALTIIVSPLKALMKDQVDGLIARGVASVCYLNSDQSYLEREESISKIKSGDISLLYLSPELLIANSNIENIIGDREIGAFIIDEAHTVSSWGRDFRVDYWLLGTYINKIRSSKNYFPIVATTATAIYNGPNDTVFEIVNSLGMKNLKFYIGKVRKNNIEFNIRKAGKITGSHELYKDERTIEVIKEKIEKNEKTIFYFPYTTQIENIYSNLPEFIQKKVARYHSKLNIEEKNKYEYDFKNNELPVMLATKAFGMGIDIDNIVTVYHFAPSDGLADYVQEIGRCARDKNLIGVAENDFHERDLKYTRVLKQLSGIKQWQVKLVMEKLFELYKINGKKSNMLITPESFSYIFNKSDDLEQKVKLALLSIENDLKDRYTYPAVIVRPKMTFTKSYVAIRKEKENEIITSDNQSYFKKMTTVDQNSRIRITGFGKMRSETIIKDLGDIYEFDLENFWEDKHNDISFQYFLRKFYKGEVFNDDDVNPRLNLSITLNNSRTETFEDMENMLELLGNIFSQMDGFFTKKDFSDKLKKELKSDKLCRKIINVIFSQYVFKYDPSGMQINKNKFLRSKRDGLEEKFCMINANFNKVKSKLRRFFGEILQGENEDRNYSKYISFNNEVMELAYILEALELANYEVSGGRIPKIFIRLNDPNKIYSNMKNDRYSNSIVAANEKRNRDSEKILRSFFTSDLDCNARWDYIENYFLGRELIA